jgi:hypothetical protein
MLLLPIVGIARDIPEEPGLTYLWRQGDGPIGGGFGISVTLEVIQTERREVMSVNGNLKLTRFRDIGQHQRGLDTIQRALEIDPSNAQVHVARGAMRALMGLCPVAYQN